jgi:hypothetical protein
MAIFWSAVVQDGMGMGGNLRRLLFKRWTHVALFFVVLLLLCCLMNWLAACCCAKTINLWRLYNYQEGLLTSCLLGIYADNNDYDVVRSIFFIHNNDHWQQPVLKTWWLTNSGLTKHPIFKINHVEISLSSLIGLLYNVHPLLMVVSRGPVSRGLCTVGIMHKPITHCYFFFSFAFKISWKYLTLTRSVFVILCCVLLYI